VSILTERGYGPTRRELLAFINALDDDEKAAEVDHGLVHLSVSEIEEQLAGL
jgi:hypothetical protein